MQHYEFHPIEHYQPTRPYTLLPFRFLSLADGRILLVNEGGEFLITTALEFRAFVEHKLSPDQTVYSDLKAATFLSDDTTGRAVQLTSAVVRTRRAFLAGFVKLHMFVVSLRCEHSCPYCQVSRQSTDRSAFDMSEEDAESALDLAFRTPAPEIKIEIQGGEPLLAFDRIRQIVLGAKRRSAETGKEVDFVIATNLALITNEMLDFIEEHRVHISTSLDGPEDLHNANRPRPGNDSYQSLVRSLEVVRKRLGRDAVSALMTTTRLSLHRPEEIVDAYVRLGFGAIFLRNISPYGFAVKTRQRIGYSIDEFLAFYFRALDYILALNRRGVHFVEIYAQVLLRRILTPFPTGYVDLQSPAGAGTSAVVYNYNGGVYVSDEARMLAEMGDEHFRLGHVSQPYEDLFGSGDLWAMVEASIAESIPGCHDCALLPYCGCDPVFNYATDGTYSGHQPSSEFHIKNYRIIQKLIELYEADPDNQRIFWAWITNKSAPAALTQWA